MPAEQVVTELIVDARGAQRGTAEYEAALQVAQRAVDRFSAAQDKQRQSTAAAGQAEGAASQKIEQSARAYSYAERQLNTYLGRLDPAFFASRRLADEQGRVEAALKALDRQLLTGAVSVSEFNQRSAQLSGRMGEVRQAAQQLAAGAISVEQAMGAMSTAAERRAGSLATEAAAAAALSSRMAELRTRFDPAAAAAARLDAELTDLAEAERLGVQITGGYSAALIGLIDKYDLTAQSARRAAAAQQEMIAQARAAQTAINSQQAFTAALATPVSSGRSAGSAVNLSPAIGSAAVSASAFEEAFRQQDRLATAAQRYRDQLNPLLPLQRAYKAELASINQVAAAGLLTDQQRLASIQRTKDAFAAQVAGLRTVHEETGRATASTGQMRASLINLGQQAQDVVVSLQAGQRPMTVLLQQGSQIATVFAATPGGVSGVLGAAATAIRGLITPATAAVAGITALGAAFAILLFRAHSNNEQLRQFNIILETTGRAGQTTAANVRAAARELQLLGLGRDEAIAAQSGLLRSVQLNPALSGRLGVLGANVGQALGIGSTAGIDRLKAAATDGVDALVKLGLEMGKLSVAEATAFSVMAQRGEGLRAQNELIRLYAERLKGLRQDAMSPMEDAANRFGVAWSDMLDRFSKTGPIKAAEDALVNFMRAVSGAIEGKFPVGDRFTSGGPQNLPNLLGLPSARMPVPSGVVAEATIPPPASMAAISGFVGGFGINFPTLANGGAGQMQWTARNMGAPFDPSNPWATPLYNSPGMRSATAADAAVMSGAFVGPDLKMVATANAERQKYVDTTKQMVATESQWGAQQRITQAYFSEYNSVLERTKDKTLAHAAAQEAAKRASQLYGIEVQKLTTLQSLATDGERAVAEALKISEAEALKVTVAYQAQLDVRQGRATDQAARAEELLAANAAKTAVELQRAANENQRNVEIIQLETQLQGQLPETIQQQVTLLQAKQELQRRGVDASSEEGQNYLRSVDALAQMRVRQIEVNREAERTNDLYRSIGDTISRSIGDVIEGIFDPSRARSWGESLKSIFRSLGSSLIQGLLVRPLTGELLGLLGASPSVVSQYGTFGGTASGSSSTFSTGNLLSAGGLLKDIFGIKLGGEGGLFGGTSGLFGNLGGSLGFAQSVPVSSLYGIEASTLNSLGLTGNVTVPGSIFGTTTLGGALGGLGLGAGAGGLLAGLLGGNSMLGGIGGAVGGLAGTLLPSLLGISLGPLGGLAGGLLGGLFGLFGNSKPRNQSAGASFDLSNFSLTAGFAGGNAQIDQQVQQIGQGLQQFLELLKTTGGSLTGNLLLQSGVNTGITADSSLPGYSGRFSLGKDPTAALNTISLALARSLTGISDTMRTVIDQISDPAEIQSAIAFATAYDDLKTAADDAFKSVEDAAKTAAGPFAQAMTQITTIFDGLTAQANRFGLALDPINAALAEATRRLQGDFLDALNVALNEATGRSFINQLQNVYDATLVTIRESQAIGLGADPATQSLIDQVYQAQLNSILKGLDTAQLSDAVTEFTGLNDAIVILANSAAGATAEMQQLAAQGQQASRQILDFLDQLAATASPFVSPEQALLASQSQYEDMLRKAQSGDVQALLDITGVADQYIKNIASYYASTVEGQMLVQSIVDQLQVLSTIYPVPQDDPTVALLTDQLSRTDTLTTTVATGADQTVLTITAGTQQLIDANNLAAADVIARNSADLATLAGVTTETAAANIAANQIASATAIAANDNAAARVIAQNAASAADLVAANDNAAAAIIAQANANSAALLVGASSDTVALGLVVQNVGDEIVQGLAAIGGNGNVEAIYGAASSIVQAAAGFSNSEIAAVYGAASSLINTGATYSNAVASAVYGAAGNLAAGEAVFANSTVLAISTASASNDNLLRSANSWLEGVYRSGVDQRDTMIRQLQDLQNKLQQAIDELRMMRQERGIAA